MTGYAWHPVILKRKCTTKLNTTPLYTLEVSGFLHDKDDGPHADGILCHHRALQDAQSGDDMATLATISKLPMATGLLSAPGHSYTVTPGTLPPLRRAGAGCAGQNPFKLLL